MQTAKRLMTVKNAAECYKFAGFSQSSFRWLIFNAKQNGFNICLRRLGRKILIDLDQFENWIEANSGVKK